MQQWPEHSILSFARRPEWAAEGVFLSKACPDAFLNAPHVEAGRRRPAASEFSRAIDADDKRQPKASRFRFRGGQG
jgi:hypothetical protein